MRLVTGMGSTMYRESAALNECFVAGLVITGIGTLIGMDSIVALKVRLPIEALQ